MAWQPSFPLSSSFLNFDLSSRSPNSLPPSFLTFKMDIDSRKPPLKTPHLLRVFVKPSTFFPTYLFHETKTLPTEDEYNLYAYEETTLQEIVQGLVGLVPEKLRHYHGNWGFR